MDKTASSDDLDRALAAQADGRIDDAKAFYERVVMDDPAHAAAWNNLGNIFSEEGRSATALEMLARAERSAPDDLRIASNRMMALHYAPQTTDDITDALRRFGERFSERPRPLPREPYAGRPLRVGFVSPDFISHPVGLFLTPLFDALDWGRVTPIAYFTGPYRDRLTADIRGKTLWREAADLSPDDLAMQIKRDGVDILIDLSGHTRGNRLALFAKRPAPVQISWLGYFATTGVSAMDYVLMDRWHVPKEAEQLFGERVLHFAHGRFCFRPIPLAPEISPPPFQRRGHVTFGSFNNTAKINNAVVAVWAAILRLVPESRLVLKWRSLQGGQMRQSVIGRFAQEGVSRDRLDLRADSPHPAMLAEYADIDIALDPFPFSGGHTSCEALWMGLPIVTWPGFRPISRQTYSLLAQLQRDDWMGEWVAGSADDYIEKAVALAAQPDRLIPIRYRLRPAMQASALMDSARFAEEFTALVEAAWGETCAGVAPPTDDPACAAQCSSDKARQLRAQIDWIDSEADRLRRYVAAAETARSTILKALKTLTRK